MKPIQLFQSMVLIGAFALSSCSKQEIQPDEFMIGGDISILKKLEDYGGVYTWKGEARDALDIFTENGFNYGRVRLFHTPNDRGPVCNSLPYTIELSKKIKASGMKLMLDIHYSDTWADPAHQIKPKAWENLSFEVLTDSVYHYSKNVIIAMKEAGVLPDIVQVGNEITPGMIWPDGKIYHDGKENWEGFCTLLKAGIKGVKEGYGNREACIMIHIDKGGDQEATEYFFRKIKEQGVAYDLVGQSYYPWWHGTFEDLEQNLAWMSSHFTQDIIIVETAYYSNGYYPEPDEWVFDIQPFPPTEEGQYDFLITLDSLARKFPKVKGIFYWEPENIDAPGSGIHYLGRSLFDPQGNALKGIGAFKK